MAQATTNQSFGATTISDPAAATTHNLIARKIDEISNARRKQQEDDHLLNPNRKLDFKPDIESADDAWKVKRAYFRDRLQKVSVQTVLDEDFEEAQTLYVHPPLINGDILMVQNEHTLNYKAALSGSEKFKGIPDNLATKFTMLHFGLHVAPLTLNNIIRCSKPEDDDDPEDEPEDLPRYQRIMYAEKPLEFLDEYHERSHGYPILRRKAPVYRTAPTAPAISKGQGPKNGSFSQSNKAPTNSPIFPELPTVGIRGGAGSAKELNKSSVNALVYGPNQKTKRLTVNQAEDFLKVASELLGFDINRDFEFLVALYRNDGVAKRTKAKHLYRAYLMNHDVFDRRYIESISRALGSPHWIVVVLPASEKAPSNFNVGGPTSKTVTFQSTQNREITPFTGLDHTSPSNSTQESHPTAKISTVYGYAGRLTLGSDQVNSQSKFLDVASRLLGRPNNVQSWPPFQVVILSSEDNSLEAIHVVNKEHNSNLDKVFDSVRDIFHEPEIRSIFIVPSGYAYPQTISELTPHTSQVCELTLPGVGTAYWKIPPASQRNSKELPAINQLQPGFNHALQFLFQDLPFGEVKVEGAPIGHGGFELTWNTWAKLRERYQKSLGMIKFNVSFTPGTENRVLLRQIGSSLAISSNPTNLTEVFDEIHHALKQNSGGALPDMLQFWGKPSDRDTAPRTSGIFIPLKKDLALPYLEAALNSSGKIRIAHFRPEWNNFTIKFVGDSTTHQWEQSLNHGSLKSFRAQVKQSFPEKGFEEATPLIISEIGGKLASGQENRRFLISKETTEQEWRLHIFNWLSSNTLEVKIGSNNPHVLNPQTPWGLFFANNSSSLTGSPSPQQKSAGNQGHGKSGNAATSSSQPIFPQTQQPQSKSPKPTPPQTQPTKSKSPQLTGSQTLGSGIFQNTAPKPTRFNKPRYEADKAGQYPVQSYFDWNNEQRFQDRLHFSSYVKDQGVVEPGRAPAAPIYGESIQAPLKISSSLPTIYVNRGTPTDIRQIREETQILRNSVLDREHMCRICSVTFRDYEKDQIAKHYTEHQDRERLDGICIWCGSTQWAFMSTEAKQTHLREHLDKENTLKIKEFWEAHNCPACNKSFTNVKPDDIVAHCINAHAPGTVQFCDKCGIKETGLIQAHRDHHEIICRQSPDESPGADRPDFCIRCGKNTASQTPEEAHLHDRDCRTTGNFFCQLDGFEVTNFSTAALAAHSQDCRRPGGRRKMYCRKCGMKLEGIDQVAWNHHQETCWQKREVTPQNHNITLKEIQQEKAKLAQAHAVVRAREDLNRRRLSAFNRRDHELKEKERNFERIQRSREEGFTQEEERLNIRDRALTAVQRHRLPDSNDLGPCPFNGCDVVVGLLARKQLYNHLAHHSSDAQSGTSGAAEDTEYIRCPLPHPDGTKCNRKLEVSNDVDFGVHLVHGLSPADQRQSARRAAVYHAKAAKANKRLRDASRELEKELRIAKEVLTPHNSQETSKDVMSSHKLNNILQDIIEREEDNDEDDDDVYDINDSPPPVRTAFVEFKKQLAQQSKSEASGTKRKAQEKLLEVDKRLKTSNADKQVEYAKQDLETEHAEDADTTRRGRSRKVHFDPTYRPRSVDSESESSGASGLIEKSPDRETVPAPTQRSKAPFDPTYRPRPGDLESEASDGASGLKEKLLGPTQKSKGQGTTPRDDNGPKTPTAPKKSKKSAASVELPAVKSNRKRTPTTQHKKTKGSTATGEKPKRPAPKRAKVAQSNPPIKGKR